MNALPFRLTFGVELEFIVRYDSQNYQDELQAAEGRLWHTDSSPTLHEKYGILVRLHMIQTLIQNGFPTNPYGGTDFSKWTVDTDITVTPVDTSGYWYAIELKSPAFLCSRLNLEPVKTIVELLVSNFSLYINESCGLHVHVGNEDRGFTLCTLKSFCSLITAFEHQLNSLHPPQRLHSPYVKSMRRVFAPGASPKEKMSTIDELQTVPRLIRHFHPLCDSNDNNYDRYVAFNFLNLHKSPNETGTPLGTIEFRQHRGTLDPNLITNWIMVACSLVNMSHTESSVIRDLIDKHINNVKYTVLDLFKDLNLPDLAEFYAPVVFDLYGIYQNPATVDESMEDEPMVDESMENEFMRDVVMEYEELDFIEISSPGKYDTPWEKLFAPRPPSELRPYRQSFCHDSTSDYVSSLH